MPATAPISAGENNSLLDIEDPKIILSTRDNLIACRSIFKPQGFGKFAFTVPRCGEFSRTFADLERNRK
jgi:hypothetical protein